MRKQNFIDTVLAALFLALGIVLPFLTSQIKEIGDSLLPMHLTALLCGIICGKWYGLLVGFLTPLMRGVLFGMPPLYPNAVYMAFEIAAYGFIIGLLYKGDKKRPVWYGYVCLIIAQLSGRIVWGIGKVLLMGAGTGGFTFKAFLIGGFIDALPGIVLQLVLVPVLANLVDRLRDSI